MIKKLNKTDARRVATIEKFLKNANHQLRKKSLKEQEDILEFQEKIIKGISDDEYREWLLKMFIELKDTALLSKKKFDSSIKKLKNCEKLLKWKTLDEIKMFFDELDNDLSVIPDQKVRQTLLKQSEDFRKRQIEKLEVLSIEKRIENVENNHSLAWNTKDEINRFFDELDFDIFKMDSFFELNKQATRHHFLFRSEILRDKILSSV